MPQEVKRHRISIEIGRPICGGHFRAPRPCGYDKKRIRIIKTGFIIKKKKCKLQTLEQSLEKFFITITDNTKRGEKMKS